MSSLKQPLRSSSETLRSLPFSFQQSDQELSLYSTQAPNKLQERTAHAQQPVGLGVGRVLRGRRVFQKWDLLPRREGQRQRQSGRPERCRGSCQLFWRQSTCARAAEARGGGWAGGGAREGRPGERRVGSGGRAAGRRLGAEASGRQGEALPHALGPPGAGAAGRGAEAASISGALGLSLARWRSLFLPLAHTGTHPTSPQQPPRRTHSPAFP